MRLSSIFFVILCFCVNALDAQEFNLNVKVSAPTTKLIDPKVYKTFENQIKEFYNTNRWTEHDFEPEERIEGDLLITIKDEISTSRFIADITIQTIRPVFNASVNTRMMNHIDKEIAIDYIELQPIYRNLNGFTDNLSQILTFYAYVMLGYDYDSFAPNGGQEYFQIAENIMSNVPTNVVKTDRAWDPMNRKRSRYSIINNLMNPRAKEFRQAMYDYHRNGMDLLATDLDRAKVIMLDCLQKVEQLELAIPNCTAVNLFVDTKRGEIVDVFQGAEKKQRNEAYRIMVKVDPAQTDRYISLKN